MQVTSFSSRLLQALVASGPIASAYAAVATMPRDSVIERDIAILGGGASGTYAAVNLVLKNKTVVVIEKKDRLGGHTDTYTDPNNGDIVNYGVQLWNNDSITRDYFNALKLQTTAPTGDSTSLYVDFNQSVIVENYTVNPFGPDYLDQAAKYPYLDDGFYLPDDIPEDLFLTFPEYAEKYNISYSAHEYFQAPSPAGTPLTRLAMYGFNFVNSVVRNEMLGNGLALSSGDNSELFTTAAEFIGEENVLLSTTIADADRNSSGVYLQTSTGKCIHAKQLIVAAPPRADNLATLNLDQQEQEVLGQVAGYPFYAGVVNNTGLPVDFAYNNVGANTEFQVQSPPYLITVYPATDAGLFYYTYGSLETMTQQEVEDAAAKSIKNIQQALKANGSDVTAEPNFPAFADHSPFHFEQSVDDIKNGFYSKFYDLQGHSNTWYIGALLVLSSSQLWNNTAALLPSIIAAADNIQ